MKIIWWCPTCKREVHADDVVRDRHLVVEWCPDTMLMDRVWHVCQRREDRRQESTDRRQEGAGDATAT